MKDQGHRLGDQANTGAVKGTQAIHRVSLVVVQVNQEGEDLRLGVS